MSKPRTSAVCVLSAEEVEDWHGNGTYPSCSDHDHITERDANIEVYPWQTVNQTEFHQLSKVVGQIRGKICIQRMRAYNWAIVYDRPNNEIFRPLPDKPRTAGPGSPSQKLVDSPPEEGMSWGQWLKNRTNGWPGKMIEQRKAEQNWCSLKVKSAPRSA